MFKLICIHFMHKIIHLGIQNIYVTYTLKNKIPITANISWIPVQEKSINNRNFVKKI